PSTFVGPRDAHAVGTACAGVCREADRAASDRKTITTRRKKLLIGRTSLGRLAAGARSGVGGRAACFTSLYGDDAVLQINFCLHFGSIKFILVYAPKSGFPITESSRRSCDGVFAEPPRA